MTTHRFFIPPENIKDGRVSFPAELQGQIGRVLRLKPGDMVQALDNQGNIYQVSLEKEPDGFWHGRILSVVPVNSEPHLRLTLYFGLTQREKVEWILQKGTEVGVAAFQPFISRRTLVQQIDIAEKHQSRWISILREAAEQSGRGCVPGLFPALNLADAVMGAMTLHELVLAAWEEEHLQNLNSVIGDRDLTSIGLLCGPEGGFDSAEIELMRTSGVKLFSLGKRILRMETAAILAPALVLYEMGELNISEQPGGEHIL
jgi:16S rRNA (uracil1498-N3)-methyltransferase